MVLYSESWPLQAEDKDCFLTQKTRCLWMPMHDFENIQPINPNLSTRASPHSESCISSPILFVHNLYK